MAIGTTQPDASVAFVMKLTFGTAVGLQRQCENGNTNGMKTEVSIPDSVFEKAERLARLTKKSRSRLFSDAVREYVARHAPDDVTAAMDKVCANA